MNRIAHPRTATVIVTSLAVLGVSVLASAQVAQRAASSPAAAAVPAGTGGGVLPARPVPGAVRGRRGQLVPPGYGP